MLTDLSDLFPNIHVERDMTTLFICILYIRSGRDINIEREGMDPWDIWRIMDYQAFGMSVVPAIINRLINNGIQQGLIRFNKIQ
jgi:hypothetical protein